MAKMRDGAQWLSNHYAANDYYCEGEHVVGSWAGKGAEFFGIAGQQIEPQNEAFLRLFSGQTPEGEKLKPHESEIIGYDFPCSAQKSVSIMAKLGGDDRLLEAHKLAVTEAYRKLESLACVKEGTLGIDRQRVTTGVLCSARFEHDTSRALDPHIHTHFATSNFSITRPCGVTWKNSGIVRAINSMSGARSKALRSTGSLTSCAQNIRNGAVRSKSESQTSRPSTDASRRRRKFM
jgi:conjugative relaxase-like TrwC/TraI family protein